MKTQKEYQKKYQQTKKAAGYIDLRIPLGPEVAERLDAARGDLVRAKFGRKAVIFYLDYLDKLKEPDLFSNEGAKENG